MQQKEKLIIYCPWGKADSPQTLSGMPCYITPFLSEKFELIVFDSKNLEDVELSFADQLAASAMKITNKVLSRIKLKRQFQFQGVSLTWCFILGKKLTAISRKYNHRINILTFGVSATRFYSAKSPVYQFIDGIYTFKIPLYVLADKISSWENENINKTDLWGIQHSKKILCTSDVIKEGVKDFLGKNIPAKNPPIINVGTAANIPIVQELQKSSSFGVIQMVFIYSDFTRKGGDIVMQISAKLDIPHVIHFIGRTPQLSNGQDVKNIIFHGFIDKNKDFEKYAAILKTAQVNLMPTRGDLTPHVICECNAFGIPTIANNIGGIKDLVGEGGILVEGLEISGYLEAVKTITKDIDQRSRLSFEKYKREQTWAIIAEKIGREILKA